MITRELARIKIQEIIDTSDAIKTGITLPIRKGEKFKVYKLPLEYLVPNILNDRIAWKIREFEASQGRKLDVENENDVEYVYSLIENETPNENRKTIADLAEKGQLIDAIVTQDGRIIDGNRRATLLRRLFMGEAKKFKKSIEDFRYLKAVVLQGDITEKEIMSLETQIQIGEDIKVNYNRINLYIKVDNLLRAGYNYEQIASFMGYQKNEVKKMHDVFQLMETYLSSIGKPYHYTLLDKLEDQFINTNTMFKKLDSGSYKADWKYTRNDVSKFKTVCFEYMRSKYEGKEYRSVLLGRPQKADGVLVKKEIWEEFLGRHKNIINNKNPQSESDWQMLKPQLEGNLNHTKKKLSDHLEEKDINGVIDAIYQKSKKLKNLIQDIDEISEKSYIKLNEISKLLYRLHKDFS